MNADNLELLDLRFPKAGGQGRRRLKLHAHEANRKCIRATAYIEHNERTRVLSHVLFKTDRDRRAFRDRVECWMASDCWGLLSIFC